jgi:hypothetical protein
MRNDMKCPRNHPGNHPSYPQAGTTHRNHGNHPPETLAIPTGTTPRNHWEPPTPVSVLTGGGSYLGTTQAGPAQRTTKEHR